MAILMKRFVATCCVTLLLGLICRSAAAEKIVMLPKQIKLATKVARQTVLIQRQDSQGRFIGQTKAKIESSNPKVVVVENGVARPVGDGVAYLSVVSGKHKATAKVVVSNQKKKFVWNFRNHVESVLSKAGCNGGACHGARAGQKGFRLTLFGFDVKADHAYLTKHARGRRVVLGDPGRSLILTKPTGLIPHKGGVRLKVGSPEYRVLAEWIAAGAPGPKNSDRQIQRLEVLPKYSRQVPGKSQQLVVLAHFSDGHVEDVTRWSKFTTLNSSAATVDGLGKVSIVGPGEAPVKVWYLNRNELAFISVPYANQTTPQQIAKQTPINNFIDKHVLTKLQALRLPPSPTCDDGTFIRRFYLDSMGVLPTAAEVRSFVADKRADKRSRLIDKVFARPEFVDYWAYKWSDLLLVNGSRLRPAAVKSYYGWIRARVADNTPWDEFVRRIVTATGSTLKNGAANFYALHQDANSMAETVSQAFLGLSIGCAKCHNHPLEKWTNDQYYGMANMFARVRGKGWGGSLGGGDGNRIVFSATQGELIQPNTGRPQPPRPLDAKPMAFGDTADRRIYVADWLTSPKNPYFTRAIVNRIWANYFGVGLIEKVDDVRATNPASNEPLLQALCDHLVQNKYDLKALMKAMANSATYQRSSKSTKENRPDRRFYSRYYPRRLKAEVMLDALSKVTAVPTTFGGQKKGTRALQLPDANIGSYFLSTFGRPERLITCECERSDEPSMTQVLHIYNGKTLNLKLQSKDGVIAKSIKGKKPIESIIDDLYVAALARSPNKRERARLLAVLKESKEKRRLLIEDLYWSVLSSREFLFNH